MRFVQFLRRWRLQPGRTSPDPSVTCWPRTWYRRVPGPWPAPPGGRPEATIATFAGLPAARIARYGSRKADSCAPPPSGHGERRAQARAPARNRVAAGMSPAPGRMRRHPARLAAALRSSVPSSGMSVITTLAMRAPYPGSRSGSCACAPRAGSAVTRRREPPRPRRRPRQRLDHHPVAVGDGWVEGLGQAGLLHGDRLGQLAGAVERA